MNAPTRLALYGAALVAVFAVAFATAGAIVPEDTVRNWSEQSVEHTDADHETGAESESEEGAGHDH